jgi:subtilisin family serine protease
VAPQQWGLDQVEAPAAWSTATGDGVTIAIVDSGVDLSHEDLAGKTLAGANFVGCADSGPCGNGDWQQPGEEGDPHGTHVAGIAAAVTGNGIGIAGVARDAQILPVRVLSPEGGTFEEIAAGVRWAADQGADVINLSLGSTTSAVFDETFADAVRYAWSQGAIPVVAAGNDYVLTADLDDAPAVVVSATDREDLAPGYSNGVGEARWAVAAPGGDGTDTPASCSQQGEPRGILSTFWSPADGSRAYACLSGTSMAAPHVSGGLALLRATGLSPAEAVQRLLDTAVDLGEPGPDPMFGAGRIDLAAAVALDGAAVPVATPAPTAGTIERPGEDGGAVMESSPPQLVDLATDVLDPDGDVPVTLAALAILLVAVTGAGAVALARSGRHDPPGP